MTDRTAPSSDARKRHHERDMADAHATARARDARVEESFEERAERYGLDWDVVAHLMSEQPTRRAYRTRTQAIDPETGTFTPLTQEPDMTDQPEPYDFHDEAHRALLNDDLSKGWQAGLHALLAIHDTLTEIRDRLPEPEGEPMCGYSKCPTEPIPVPRPEAEGVPVGEHHPLANLCQRHYCEHEHDPLPADEVHFVKPDLTADPAPADDLPGEPDDRCPHDIYDRGDGTVSECSLPKGHAPTAHDSGDGVMWTDGEHWKDEESNLDDLPGEPVEPGDLRAGDRVAFTWLSGERMTCTLVEHSHLGGVLHSDVTDASGVHRPNLTSGDLWATGISDVRLIERAPREDEDPDEALAKAICESLDFPPTSLLGCAVHAAVSDVLAARKHIEAEQEEVVATLREEVDIQTARAERAEVERAEFNGFWKEALADVRKARGERDALRERLDAFRADVEARPCICNLDESIRRGVLDRDDERAAKGVQR